ncbi:MAG: glycoside hydrolase family 31 protein [Chloroflexi bacterium]|nr:glycoside hydrolase family 31 protein [Chloroflexota bacterium]
MPLTQNPIAHALHGIRTVGFGRAVQSAVYPLRRTYYEAKFSAGDNRGSIVHGLAGLIAALRGQKAEERLDLRDFVLLGDVLSHRQEGQRVYIRCQNAALEITILAPDLVRVRLIFADHSPLPHSYVVSKADSAWIQAPYTLIETEDAIEIRTARMSCHVAKNPCRLSFHDLQGQLIHADSAGLAWKGEKVARFATLTPEEHIYGLGEKAFPLDRRGHRYLMWNIDPQNYGPADEPIYLSIPFCIGLHNGQGYGILYDNSYRAHFDVGESQPGEVIYLADGGELCYYFFYGPALTTVLERYTELTGRMALPPLWALGYHQSRWSYYPDSKVREIARLFREHRIPCDALYLDIHYMDGYRCFTWHPTRFPNPSALLTDLHNQGFKVVVIIDCGIKADRKYPVCAEGIAKGMFCTYPDGTLAGGPVWPGESYFPDFTNPRVREWWGNLHAPLLQVGVDGIWNDMNEPTVTGPKGDTLAGCVRHNWEGQGADHRQAHNVYGMQMVRATAEGLQRLRPEQRPFVLTRSGWAGVQRYAISWTGDNLSTWEHLRLTMPMVMGLGLSGLAFTGADVGGFSGGAEAELLVRWIQMGAFLPFFRNHASLWSRAQEPWAYGEPYLSLNRNAVEWRYRLLPYLYTATWQCAQNGLPIARPLVLAYPEDERTHALDDEFLCGDALLVAPICEPQATSREVYLPAGNWFDFWTDEQHRGQKTIRVAAPLERIPVFVRAGTVLPTWPVMQHTDEQPVDRLILHVYPGDGQSWLYEDDGHSLAYLRGEYRLTRFTCQRTAENGLSITRQAQGPYCPAYTRWEWTIHGLEQAPAQVLADGQPVQDLSWDEASHMLRFETSELQSISLM